MEVQEVEILACICGDYAAFHEVSISASYDFTNSKVVNEEIPEEFYDEKTEQIIKGKEKEVELYMRNLASEDGDYCDYDIIDAICVNGEYYMSIE